MKITGTHLHASREFIKAWVNASAALLSYHSRPVDLEALTVQIVDLSSRRNRITGRGVNGVAVPALTKIKICKTIKSAEDIASTILHEMIHLGCGDFGEGTDEKCTSTLTARLKPVVARLAGVLLEEDNRNRAIFAHSRPGMAYTTKGEGDRYDPDQWVHVGVKDKHHKRRSAAKESE